MDIISILRPGYHVENLDIPKYIPELVWYKYWKLRKHTCNKKLQVYTSSKDGLNKIYYYCSKCQKRMSSGVVD